MDTDGGSSLIIQIFVLLFLTLVNAFFAMAEIAVISVDDNKINDRIEKGDKKAKKIKVFKENQSKFLSTIQVGITFANLFSSAFAATSISNKLARLFAGLGLPYSSSAALVIVTLILSYITLVFGELVPKRLALQKPEKISNFVIGPINVFAKLTSPFIGLLTLSTNSILRILGVDLKGVEERVTMEDLKSLLHVGQQQGVINPIERSMIDSIIVFDDKQAEEIMTARTEVFAIDILDPFSDYLDEVLDLRFSRIPVYEDDIDNIIGILFTKDLLKVASEKGLKDLDLRPILREPYFVPERKNISELFVELKTTRNHIAVLIDEYGGFTGIVTMEDLLEEIVGEIDDEYDHHDPDMEKIGKNTYLVKGSMSIIDINNEIHTHLDEDVEDYDSVAGLVLNQLGYIPDEDDNSSVVLDTIKFTIMKVEDNRIQQIKMEIPEDYFDNYNEYGYVGENFQEDD